MVRFTPSRSVRKRAIEVMEPLSSIILPKMPPSRNIGNHCVTNRAVPPMNVEVQCGNSGWPEAAATMRAAAGARSSTLQPR